MNEPLRMLRVLLADDHPVYRAGLAGLLSVTGDLQVAAQVANGSEAVAQCLRLRPDVAVLDLNMPGADGLAATREIVASCPQTAVLVLTMFDDDTTIFQAIRAGARGYAVKSESPETILAAVRAVARGETVFSAALAGRMTSWFAALERATASLAHLTAREREVLALMVRGRDNASIANLLGISDKTVRNVVSNVFAKLQVADRPSAIAKARQAGVV